MTGNIPTFVEIRFRKRRTMRRIAHCSRNIEKAFRSRKIWVSAMSQRRGMKPSAATMYGIRPVRGECFGRCDPVCATCCDSIAAMALTIYVRPVEGRLGAELVTASARFGTSRGAESGNPASAVPTHHSVGQMELFVNSVVKQRLAAEVPSRLRVICATPIQKRADSHRSKRFLCCVCRSVR